MENTSKRQTIPVAELTYTQLKNKSVPDVRDLTARLVITDEDTLIDWKEATLEKYPSATLSFSDNPWDKTTVLNDPKFEKERSRMMQLKAGALASHASGNRDGLDESRRISLFDLLVETLDGK